MGNQGQKPVAKKVSMEDNIIDIKIQCKTLARAAKKAQKQGAVYQKKAKQALKKNNQQGAKMYLMSAAAKTKQAQSCERTAMKMQFMCGQIKSMKTNEQFMNSFGTLTQMANQQMNNFDATKMAEQMQMFNTKMDEMMINTKMVTEIMDTNQIEHGNTVQQMKQALQQQIAMEQQNKMEEQHQIQYQKQKAEGDKFMDDLKDL